jgi:hypothetical protein
MSYFKMVHSVVPSAVCLDIAIENIVGTAFLGHAVDMNKTFEWLKSQGYVTAMVRLCFVS